MPVAGQRDPAEIRSTLEVWLARQLPDATDVTVTDLVVPQSSGFSNETFLLDARWRAGGETIEADLVLRSQPQVYALFPEIDVVSQQFTTMKLLGEHSSVPVARMRWAEPDPAVLGQPFFVMDRLHGQVPGDSPTYTAEGFVMELPPEKRHRLHVNGVRAMASVARVDWRTAGFHHLDLAHHGPLGPGQRRNYFRHYLEWACGETRHPVVHPTWDWLEANWPDDGDRVELCWGDARPGNQMYAPDSTVVALFDWEMVSLGNSESDLGWWCFLQRYHTDGLGIPLPEGLLTRAETIDLWEQEQRRPASHIDFYERLAGFQFSLVLVRMAAMMELLTPDTAIPGMGVYNPVVAETAKLLGLPVPAP